MATPARTAVAVVATASGGTNNINFDGDEQRRSTEYENQPRGFGAPERMVNDKPVAAAMPITMSK